MKIRLLITFSLITFSLSGCGFLPWTWEQWLVKPDQFKMNRNQFEVEEIGGFIICPLDSVEHFAKNGILLHSGSLVDMYCNEFTLTQFRADFTTELTSGEGTNFYFRTIADHFELHPNITFDYSTSGCKVYDSGSLIANVDSIKAELNKPARILIENYGNLVNIVVDCDTVYYGKTKLPATQHIILKPHTGTDIKYTGIQFNDLNGDILKTDNWLIDSSLRNE